MAPFYGWGSTASKLEALRGGSVLSTTKFPEFPGTHFIDLGRMKGWVCLGATQWFWTRDPLCELFNISVLSNKRHGFSHAEDLYAKLSVAFFIIALGFFNWWKPWLNRNVWTAFYKSQRQWKGTFLLRFSFLFSIVNIILLFLVTSMRRKSCLANF